jgi:hypothetical protein
MNPIQVVGIYSAVGFAFENLNKTDCDRNYIQMQYVFTETFEEKIQLVVQYEDVKTFVNLYTKKTNISKSQYWGLPD